MTTNGTNEADPTGHLLDKTIYFPDGIKFERTRPITDLRKDYDEARIVYLCRDLTASSNDTANTVVHGDQEDYIMKIKFQYVWFRKVQSNHDFASF